MVDCPDLSVSGFAIRIPLGKEKCGTQESAKYWVDGSHTMVAFYHPRIGFGYTRGMLERNFGISLDGLEGEGSPPADCGKAGISCLGESPKKTAVSAV
jgi:hypothetical protein